MNDNWYKKIIGARTIKTGLATFLTALFCLALNLNPIFAILTAIVTIEPTASHIHIYIWGPIPFRICIERYVHNYSMYQT